MAFGPEVETILKIRRPNSSGYLLKMEREKYRRKNYLAKEVTVGVTDTKSKGLPLRKA